MVDQPSQYKVFLKELDEAEGLQDILNERVDPNEPVRDAAQKKYRAYAWKNRPAGADNGNPETLSEDELKHYSTFGRNSAHARGYNTMATNLESIVQEIPTNTLDRLLKTKILDKNIPADKKKVVSTYDALQNAEDFLKRYTSNGGVKEEEAEIIKNASAEAYVKDVVGRVKDAHPGHGEDIQSLARVCALMALQHGRVPADKMRNYALPAVKSQVEKAKRAYGGATQEAGADIYAVVREGILEGAKTRKGEELNQFYRVVYAAEKNKIEKMFPQN